MDWFERYAAHVWALNIPWSLKSSFFQGAMMYDEFTSGYQSERYHDLYLLAVIAFRRYQGEK